MNKLLTIFLILLCNIKILASTDNHFIFQNGDFKEVVLKEVASKMSDLMKYPCYSYPSQGFEEIASHYPEEKSLLFGYGSLMNKISAAKTLKSEAVDSMQTAIAFGVKRVFNYKGSKPSHWPEKLDPQEKAMLNLVKTFNSSSIVNGVTLEIDLEDLASLVSREIGYDLVPILVVDEQEISNEETKINVKVAYTFAAVNELRNHINYTSTKYYPVRGYLHAVQSAAATHGEDFEKLWNQTTYMADGITPIDNWDQQTFKGILCTFEPEGDL